MEGAAVSENHRIFLTLPNVHISNCIKTYIQENTNFVTVISGASLVKGIPFNSNDPEVSGPDLFQKLVPMQAHEASSLYR